MIKKLLRTILRTVGYEIKKVSPNNNDIIGDNRMQGALKRLESVGISPDKIVDIGAARGKWTELAMDIWPNASYLLMEPIKEQIEMISSSLSEKESITIIEAVAGEREGSVKFTISEDLDGSGVYDGKIGNLRSVKVVPLDSIAELNRTGSVLLKLDTHGYELPIFNGAKEVLKNTAVIVVEVYGFYVSPTGVLFNDITKYLKDEGFRLFDIVDVKRRPADMAFWQADAVYIPANSSIFDTNSYKLEL